MHTNHAEDQPVHLTPKGKSVPVKVNLAICAGRLGHAGGRRRDEPAGK
jgi:hypothetical protein